MKKAQKATFLENAGLNGRNYGGEKEMMSTWNVVGTVQGRLIDVLTVRTYMARKSDGASPVYAGLWLHANGHHMAGHGVARGYGYHKASAAMQQAVNSAGIVLTHAIDGVGDSAIEDALIAIARAAGVRGRLCIVRN